MLNLRSFKKYLHYCFYFAYLQLYAKIIILLVQILSITKFRHKQYYMHYPPH